MIAIIQARLGSTRLPNKVLEKIGNKIMLKHCIDRVKQLPIDKIVVAASGDKFWRLYNIINDSEAEYFWDRHINENDLLKRYIMAGIAYDTDYILRVCSDMPFFSIPAAKELIKNKEVYVGAVGEWKQHDYIAHYLKDEDTPTVWKYAGHYLEVVRLSALFDVYNRLKEIKGTIDYDGNEVDKVECFKEHPTSGIYLTPERYKIKRIIVNEVPKNTAINTQYDLQLMRKLYDEGKIK